MPALSRILLTALLVCPVAAHADEAPAARAYLEHVGLLLDAAELDLPATTGAAELAAARVARGGRVVVLGDFGLATDLAETPGGLAAFEPDGAALTGDADRHDVVLYVLGLRTLARNDARALLDRQVAAVESMTAGGRVVIGLASLAQLRRTGLADRARAACTVLLDNHAPADDGLMRTATDRAVVPTFPVANAVVGWAFSAELFAACTRRGATPIVRLNPALDRRNARARGYRGQTIHDDLSLPAIPPGDLGRAYLARLRGVLGDLGTASWPALARTADRAAETILDGGRVFLAVQHRSLAHHAGGRLAADPWLLTPLTPTETDPGPNASPGADDFAIAVGVDAPPGSLHWRDAHRLRRAGRGVAWSIATHYVQPHQIRRGELLLPQPWPFENALLRVPGYDARLGGSSGVVAEVVLWSLTAQVHNRLQRWRSR